MGWIVLEALVALVLAVGIVWWTMGPRRKRSPVGRNERNEGSGTAAETDGKADDRAQR